MILRGPLLSVALLLTLSAALVMVPARSSAALDPSQPPASHDDGWPVRALAEARLDIDTMVQLTDYLQQDVYPLTHAVLIEDDGALVYEQYLTGEDREWGIPLGVVAFDHETLHDLRSITKSVTSLLLGIALGEDFEEALDRPIYRQVGEVADQIGRGAERVTLQHALTMTAGLKWNEMEVPYGNPDNDENRLYYVRDPVRMVLKRPVVTPPGTTWYYSGGLTILVGAAVTRLTGEPLDRYAEEVLFEPLGIREYTWNGTPIWDSLGTPSAASGLRLRARDLAKIGSLVLHDGRWQDRQIVPRAWIEESTERHVPDNGKWSGNGIYGYGYQWWHGNIQTAYGNYTAITGVGFGGQRLFIVPSEKLVITVFAGQYNRNSGRYSRQIIGKIMHARHLARQVN